MKSFVSSNTKTFCYPESIFIFTLFSLKIPMKINTIYENVQVRNISFKNFSF